MRRHYDGPQGSLQFYMHYLISVLERLKDPEAITNPGNVPVVKVTQADQKFIAGLQKVFIDPMNKMALIDIYRIVSSNPDLTLEEMKKFDVIEIPEVKDLSPEELEDVVVKAIRNIGIATEPTPEPTRTEMPKMRRRANITFRTYLDGFSSSASIFEEYLSKRVIDAVSTEGESYQDWIRKAYETGADSAENLIRAIGESPKFFSNETIAIARELSAVIAERDLPKLLGGTPSIGY